MRRVILLLILGLILTMAVGCSSKAGGNTADSKAGASKKYALILATGGLGDQSFNDLTYAGMKRAEKELGITFDYVEPKEVADYETQQNELAASGKYDLIVCVGFDQMDALKKVAAEYPEQKFALIDATVDAPNVASYLSEEQEGSFLVGALAGLMKKEKADSRLNDQNVAAVIGGVDIPMIRKFIAGFEAGARYVNPKMQVLYDFVGGFSDPTSAKEMALALNRKGADIIYHAAGGSGLGVFEAAKSKNFLAIGCNSNQNHIAPDVIMASMLKRVDNATFEAVKNAFEGKFKGGVYSLGIKDEGVGYTVDGTNVKIPKDILDKVEAIKAKIQDGSLKVPVEIEQVDTFLQNNKM